MARSIEPPSTDEEADLDVGNPFDEDQPTPVLAAGTRDSLADKAREAVHRAGAVEDNAREPGRRAGAVEDKAREAVHRAGAVEDNAREPGRRAGAVEDNAREPGRRAGTVEDEDVASLAHDLKNPLTIIMLEAMQIEQRLGHRITPAVQRGLERIGQNAAYIDRLISDMLDMAAADAGSLELRLERLDLSRLLRDAVGRAVPTAERNSVRLEIRDILFVQGDEMRIERVVTNLVHNALKYGGDFGPVTVRLDARGAYACVSVIDQGPGLGAEEARVVFDRYRRARRTGAKQGYGLGLYTSRRIIEAHKGRIGIVSQPGRGCRFFFELPAIAPHHMQR